jgi:AAA+ ATPase superfamily predicted ATPase
MHVEFFGREKELRLLDELLAAAKRSGRGRLVAIRGRRQVGKSRLAERFAEYSGVAYGAVAGMKGTPVAVQVQRGLDTLCSSRRPFPALGAISAVVPKNWFDLLSRLRLAMGEGPGVLVLDEFPWAVESSPGLDGLLQSLWDQEMAGRPFVVVLIGSDEAMLQRLFEHDRPLFGRVDSQLVLRPFNPAETALALGQSRSAMHVLDVHLVTGGFPELVLHARQFSSARSLVADALSRPHTLLADVAQVNLAGELAEASSARAVLEAIGADEVGVVNFSRAVAELGGGTAAQTMVSRALSVLEAKGIVSVEVPAGRETGRLKRYRIADSYLRFWFRFIEPHLRNIEVGRVDLAQRAFDVSWAAWRGKAVEPLVREGLLLLAARLGTPFDEVGTVGAWWDRTGRHEYDVVAVSASGHVVAVGSVKWRERSPFDRHDAAALVRARSVVPNAAAAKLVAVAPSGVAKGTEVDLALDAGSLLSAWQA